MDPLNVRCQPNREVALALPALSLCEWLGEFDLVDRMGVR
jgi:hypothetical protein